MVHFKIVSLNVNGLRLAPKRRALFQSLRALQADFIFLQEIHSQPSDVRVWLSEWGGKGVFAHGRTNSSGVCILFKPAFSPDISDLVMDPQGRFVILQIQQEKETVTLLKVYAPTRSEHREQLQMTSNLQENLADMEIQSLIMAGDFNIQMDDHDSMDQHVSIHRQSTTDSYTTRLQSLLEDYHLVDAWRRKNPKSTRGTFHRKQYSARLDYFFIPQYLLPDVKSIDILPEPLSDHCAILLDMTISTQTRGPGFWRFNNLLLSDPIFIKGMKDHLRDNLQIKLSNPNIEWEWLKHKARSYSISFGIRKAREERATEMDLQRRLKILADEHDLSDSQDIASEVESIKRELAEILQNKANKTIFRARANWAQYGEKPTAYFLGLEKRRSKENTITTLINEKGKTITANQDILAFEKEYFEKIFKEDPSQLSDLDELTIPDANPPQVSDLHHLLANAPFTKHDFHAALKDLNKNKSPGSDGLTPEFYLAFWDILEDPFFRSIMFSLEHDKLSEEQRTGIITLVPKKQQDRTNLSNWRPITLLNTDFKIYSKALANRIQMCITDVVQADQTGFIRGRSITSNLFNIQRVIDQATSHSPKAYF